MTTSDPTPLRGQVVYANIGGIGEKPYVIVSNNSRNRNLNDVLVARITTAAKPPLPSIVSLPQNEPVVGRVLCDDISPARKDELSRIVGGLSRRTMQAVDSGLRSALALGG